MAEDEIIFKLTADDKPLLADIARVRKQLADAKFALRASLDTSGIDRQLASLKTASVKVTADTSAARGTFADFLQSVNRQRSVVHISGDTSAARAAYDAFVASVKPINAKATATNARVTVDRSQYDSFIRAAGRQINIPARVVVDQSGLRINPKPVTIPGRVQIDRAQYDAFTRNVGRLPSIHMRADASQARSELARLSSQIASLRRQAASIRVQINTAGSQGQLAGLQRQLAAITQQTNALAQAARSIRFPAIPGGGHAGGGLGFFGGGAVGGVATRMLGGGAGATLGSTVGGAIGSFGGPGGIALGAVGGAGVGAVGDVTTSVIGNGLARLDELERYQATIKAVTRDQEKANALFAELRKLNEELPTVQMSTLAEAATKLAGSGIDSAMVPEAITSILDAAATSSDGVALGTQRVVRAISQIKSSGRLLGEEINQLTETGIPAAQILSRQFGMSIEDIKKASQRGEIAVDDIIQKLLKGFREERGGGLAQQAGTLSGKMAGLQKQFDAFSMRVAEPLLDPLIEALGRLAEAADAGALDGVAQAMIKVTEASVGFLQFITDIADRVGEQAKPNNLSVALTGGIAEGKLSDEELRNANAAQLAASKLADRRQSDGKDAILSQQETADFFATSRGEYVDPNAITDYQRQMATNLIDAMGAAEANIPVPSLRQTERTQQYAGVVGTLVDNVGPGGKFADRELDRQRVRDIAARGFTEEDQAKIRDGQFAGDSMTAAGEASNTVSALASQIGNFDGQFDEDIRGQISDITDLIISGQIDATVAELEALAGSLDNAGQSDAASRVRGAIKQREDAATKAAADAKAEADSQAKAERAKANATAAGFVNRGTSAVGGFFGRMVGKASEATGIDIAGLPSKAMDASGELRAGDALREKERLRNESDGRRFDSAAKDLPEAFKKFTADITDPEVRKIVEDSSLDLKQVANGRGGFDPELALRELGDMTQKRGTQETDMAGLGRLVQANIDDAVQREQQKKMLEAQEKIADFTKKQNELLANIDKGVNKPRETVIAGN